MTQWPAPRLPGALGGKGDGVGQGQVRADNADEAGAAVRQVDVLLRHHPGTYVK